MAEIIINTKEVIKRKSYYPDFINIIINSKEFIIPTYKESASVDDIDNIQFENRFLEIKTKILDKDRLNI